MANKSIYALAKCPFFCAETAKSVTCEGVVGKNTVTRFSYGSQKISHEKNFCAAAYAACPIYLANMKKY